MNIYIMYICVAYNYTEFAIYGLCNEMERLSGWLPWSSLWTLKLVFNVSSDDQGSHPDDLIVSVVYNDLKCTSVQVVCYRHHNCMFAIFFKFLIHCRISYHRPTVFNVPGVWFWTDPFDTPIKLIIIIRRKMTTTANHIMMRGMIIHPCFAWYSLV